MVITVVVLMLTVIQTCFEVEVCSRRLNLNIVRFFPSTLPCICICCPLDQVVFEICLFIGLLNCLCSTVEKQ